MQPNPIIIGGVGGSGTRVFANSMLCAGFRSTRDLNGRSDALACTLLFNRLSVFEFIEAGEPFERLWRILEAVIHGDRPLDKADRRLIRELARDPWEGRPTRWLRVRARRLKKEAAGCANTGQWFVKEPNLHVVAEEVLRIRPDIRFVMVVRHGVDMAFSDNLKQVATWGPIYLDDPALEVNPASALKYWCEVHRRITRVKESEPERVLVLSFDQLCREPERVFTRLLEFSGVEPTSDLLQQVAAGVRTPSSIGRRHNNDLSDMDPADMEFVESYMATIESP